MRGGYRPVTIDDQQLLAGGDVIAAVNGQTIVNVEDLQAFLQQTELGQEVTLTLLRDGKRVEVPVTLSERPG